MPENQKHKAQTSPFNMALPNYLRELANEEARKRGISTAEYIKSLLIKELT